MTSTDDSDHRVRSGAEEMEYLLRRAEDHRKLAEKTELPGHKSIHMQFKELYEERAAILAMVLPD